MRRMTAWIMAAVLCFAAAAPASGFGASEVSGRRQLIDTVVENLAERTEQFQLRYRGSQDLANDPLNELMDYDGSERSAMLSSIYGVDYLEIRSRYITGTDIRYTFTAAYDHSQTEMDRLEAELKQWVSSHVSTDMPEAVRVAVISRYLSERLQYQLKPETNNAYDGYYGLKTACSGYAELTYRLLRQVGIPVRVISGSIPSGLTDTEYLSRTVTAEDMIALSRQDVAAQMLSLHIWNLVQLNGKWHHLDTTWLDGDQDGAREDGSLHPAFFLGGEPDFARNHLWVRGGYPASSGNWWDQNTGATKDFLRAYLGASEYRYPEITSAGELDRLIAEAYQSGRAEQTFRITQGVQPYDSFPTVANAKTLVARTRSDYRVAPQYSKDRYLLTVMYRGRSGSPSALPALVSGLSVARGDSFGPPTLLKTPERSEGSAVNWLSLTPGLLKVEGDQFVATAEGRAYVGAYTEDQAVIIPVDITAPLLQVYLDGSPLALSPGPQIISGRTLVPLRGIFEAMGADVYYDEASRTVTAFRGGRSLQLTIGSSQAVVNGVETTLDVAPQLIGDRTFVPARLVAESLGATVQWDGARNRVIITD